MSDTPIEITRVHNWFTYLKNPEAVLWLAAKAPPFVLADISAGYGQAMDRGISEALAHHRPDTLTPGQFADVDARVERYDKMGQLGFDKFLKGLD